MQSDVLEFVSLFSLGQTNPDRAIEYYRETLDDIAAQPVMVDVDLIQAFVGVSTYDIPDDSIRLLAVFSGETELDGPISARVASYLFGTDWRSRLGDPDAYVREQEEPRRFHVYPTPSDQSDPLSFPLGEPLGRDFPTRTISVLTTKTGPNLQHVYDLPLGLLVIAHDYQRSTRHRDPLFSQALTQVASLLLQMID